MDYRALQTEIQEGQQASACAPYVHTNDMPKIDAKEAAAKDQSIADILNAVPDFEESEWVTVDDIFQALSESGDYVVLKRAELIDKNQYAIMAFAMFNDANTFSHGRIRMNTNTTKTQFAELLGAKLLTDAGIDAIEKMTQKPTTRMKKLLGTEVTAADVSRAVRGPWGDEK